MSFIRPRFRFSNLEIPATVFSRHFHGQDVALFDRAYRSC